MTKAAATAAPVNLGTKRTCPKCAAKFYDFAKAEIQCPKCRTGIDPNAEQSFKPAKKEAAKPRGIVRDEEEEVVVASSDAFESVEDLSDDDESLDGLAQADDDGDDDA
jgi:uncharacterized protein (TIGR02300 family)